MASRKDAARTRVATHVNDIHDRLNRISLDCHTADLTPDDVELLQENIQVKLDATINGMLAPAVRVPFALT